MATDEVPPALAGAEEGATARFRAAETDLIVAEVDDVRIGGDDLGNYAAVTLIETGHRGAVYDAESHYDPRVGWATPTVHKRLYGEVETDFVECGELEQLDCVETGIDPTALQAGDTIEHADGSLYRVVIPPTAREYDDKMLGYDLNGPSNVVEKVDPGKLLPDTLARVHGGGDE